MLALSTSLGGEEVAFFQTSSSSFYIGVLSLQPSMSQLDLAQLERIAMAELRRTACNTELRGKELVKPHKIPMLESALCREPVEKPELERTALQMNLDSLQQKEIGRFKTFQQDSSTRASDAKPDASTSSPRALRKQLRALEPRIFPSLILVIVILMIHSLTLYSLTLHSLSFLSSIRLTCTSVSFSSSFPTGWAHDLADQDLLLTTFGEQELENKAKHKGTCREEENEKQEELQILLWEQELVKHLADKTSWVDQLQKNLSENEKNKQLDENKELEEQNFQSLIFKKKLVALLPEKHFALAASSQLLGNEAWEKLKEASEEISFDNVRGKELSQELRREQRDCKELRSASLRALCPSNFEDSSLQEATFKEESFTASTFPEKSFDKSSFADSSFTEETFTKNSFTKSSLTPSSLTKTSFAKNGLRKKSFDKTSFSENTFLENSFSENSFDKSSLEAKTFNTATAKTAASTERPSDRQFRAQQLGGTELPPSSFELSSLKEETFDNSSFQSTAL